MTHAMVEDNTSDNHISTEYDGSDIPLPLESIKDIGGIVLGRCQCIVPTKRHIIDVPDHTVKHSKQNSCEHLGIRARSTTGCKHMLQWSSSGWNSTSS